MIADASTVPPFIVYQKPLFRFSRKISRVYIDDVANDVVMFGVSSGEVCFFNLKLRHGPQKGGDCPNDDENNENAAFSPKIGARETEWLRHHPYVSSDAIALAVKGRQADGSIRHAKRSPTPIRDSDGGWAHLVALSFDHRTVFFYLCQRCTGSLPLAHISMFQCSPKNLRFREEFYPIKAFYWANFQDITEQKHLQNQDQREEKQKVSRYQRSSRSESPSPSAPQQPQSQYVVSTRRILLCITSISVDLIAFEDLAVAPSQHQSLALSSLSLSPLSGAEFSAGTRVYNDNERPWILLRRFPTHSDYWHYSPTTRVLLSVNKLKPSVVKLFEITDETLHVLPKVRLDERCIITVAEETTASPSVGSVKCQMPFYTTACMDAPAVHGAVGFLVLYRQLFLLCASRGDGCAVLYRYVPAESVTTPSPGGGGGGVAAVAVAAAAAALAGGGSSTETGQFVRHAALQADFPFDTLRDPISVHVVDNLIVIHALDRGLTCCFDIMSGEEQQLIQQASAQQYSTTRGSSTARRGSVESVHSSSYSSPRASVERDSWISRLTSGLRGSHNNNSSNNVASLANPITASSGTGVASPPWLGATGGTISAFSPILTASLAPHPSVSTSESLYTYIFVSGTIPMALHPSTGLVCLVGVNPFAIAAALPQGPRRVQFYLHRSLCAGSAVPSLLRAMLAQQESLALVAPCFEAVAIHDAWQQQQQLLSPQLPPYMSASRVRETTINVLGSTTALRRCLVAVDAAGRPLPQEAPWQPWAGVTRRDILDICTTADSNVHMEKEPSVSQLVLHRDVFVPLADVVLPQDEGEELETGTRYMTRYLFFAALEYVRCVMQTGIPLIEEFQRLLLRLLHFAAPGRQSLQQLLLLPGVMGDHVPTALVLLRMGGTYRQMGLDMLSRLGANEVLVQFFLVERRPLDAARHLLAQGEPSARVLGEVLQCAMDLAAVDGQGALEFATVYEMAAAALMRQPLAAEAVPSVFATATVTYQRLLTDGLCT